MQPDDLQVEQWPIERLLPYVANARTHPDEQLAQIAGSIAEFGFNVPCLVDERGILIAGERTGRHVSAIELAPEYVDVAVLRWRKLFPDQSVTLDGAGRTFEETAAERGVEIADAA